MLYVVFAMEKPNNLAMQEVRNMKNEDHEEYDEEKHRVVTLLSQDEKDELQILAWKSGRSMSGYIRHLIVQEIAANS